eukprot:359139-Chlamydomonas_euryale.AAC.17
MLRFGDGCVGCAHAAMDSPEGASRGHRQVWEPQESHQGAVGERSQVRPATCRTSLRCATCAAGFEQQATLCIRTGLPTLWPPTDGVMSIGRCVTESRR